MEDGQRARRDKNSKEISAPHFFGPFHVEVKAPYKVWVQWEDAFMNHIISQEPFPYELIENYLSPATSEDTRKGIKEYSEKEPERFAWDFYYECLMVAAPLNPLILKKPRGKKYPKHIDMHEVRRVAKWIFEIIYSNLRRKRKSSPWTNAINYTSMIIGKTYSIKVPTGKNFYNNFIADPMREELYIVSNALAPVNSYPIPEEVQDLLKHYLHLS